MKWLCLFRPCRWRHLFNALDNVSLCGVYQCATCKTVSIGSPRDNAIGTAIGSVACEHDREGKQP